MPLLTTHNLTSGYGEVAAIHEINVSVEPGELVVILGANGAGKTTTLLSIIGQLQPMSGSVEFLDKKLKPGVHRLIRHGVAFVPQERSVIMGLTANENLAIGRGEIGDALEVFPELKPLLRRKAALLSGGEQQMVTLGRALAAKPKLLLGDELSLGLAPMAVARLLQAVRNATELGVGVILVEQNPRLALRWADRGYVLARGRVVMDGTAKELLADTQALESSYLSSELV
jgi:branched-chain amino acid transport system ATP-binding protein